MLTSTLQAWLVLLLLEDNSAAIESLHDHVSCLAGQYFSEAAMRKRQPLLHQQLIGQYQATLGEPALGTMKLSDSIMQNVEEQQVQRKLQEQKERFEQVEDEEDSSDAEAGSMVQSGPAGSAHELEATPLNDEAPPAAHPAATLSEQERAQNAHEFSHVMQQKFLAGEDEGVDYAAIDRDEMLDDLEVQAQDAEAKYFDSD